MLVSETGMLKVTDFGTSRYLEIAAHGTTVIGSPPYMAPEQFHGKAVFASDLYSVGVTMYQMLTGSMPYDTPAPADIARLARGELLSAPRIKNPKIPKAINDIVLRAMAPEPTERYQRASELLNDLLAAREPAPRRAAGRGGTATADATVAEIQSRLKARETPPARFCWHCRQASTRPHRSLSLLQRKSITLQFRSKFRVPGSCADFWFEVPGSRFVVRRSSRCRDAA